LNLPINLQSCYAWSLIIVTENGKNLQQGKRKDRKGKREDMACLEVKVVAGSGYNCIFQNFNFFIFLIILIYYFKK
jgi:hypothetical protein